MTDLKITQRAKLDMDKLVWRTEPIMNQEVQNEFYRN